MNHIDVYLYFTDRHSPIHRDGTVRSTSMRERITAMLNRII